MNIITNNRIMCTVALAGLQQVVDPEIGLNIVDLGLVYQVDFDVDKEKLYCTMTLTTRFCPMGESITDAASAALQAAFPGYDVNVALTFDPPWSHERISAEGMEYLKK